MAVVWDYPHPSLVGSHEDGATEPWIAEIVASLIKAARPKCVVELGGFMGTTSAWIALAMEKTREASTLIISEPDPTRAATVKQRLKMLPLLYVGDYVNETPSPQILDEFKDQSIDFAFVDNDHTKPHVEQEINALWPKMSPGGIMCFHDVWGVTDLQSVVRKYGGIALDLPRLGPAGGLGIIQIPA